MSARGAGSSCTEGRMLNARRGTVLLLGAALVGCTASSDRDVTAPRVNAAASARDDAASAGGAQQQVTGHANIQLPLFANAVERYSNSAIRHAGGTVSGEFELKSA